MQLRSGPSHVPALARRKLFAALSTAARVQVVLCCGYLLDPGRPRYRDWPPLVTRTRRYVRGLGAGYASQLLLAVVGLWVTRFLLEHLGQHDYGLWLVATQLLAYLML